MNATATLKETASMFRAIADHAGPYTRRGQYEVTGQRFHLTPRQSLRLAYEEWKQMPAHIADMVRVAYAETCTALDESADRKIEALNASSEKRRRQLHPVDGGCDGRDCEPADREGDRDEGQDPNVND